MVMGSDIILELRGITKKFPGVQALDHVNLELRRGEIHGLVGENGAGKSTLIKILGGVYAPDAGEIFVNGVRRCIDSPSEAGACGLSFIHQEPNVFPALSVAENIFVGSLPEKRFGFIDRAKTISAARSILAKMAIDLDVHTRVRDLRMAEAQTVEILRALSKNAQIIVMDEPTSSLSEAEKERLFGLMRSLKSQGVSIIYVSHFLDEVLTLCDRISVLKDGRNVDTISSHGLAKDDLILKMVGHSLDASAPERTRQASDVILSVRDLSRAKALSNVSFDLYRGEVLGICGLLGAGKTELARTLFGLEPADSGTISVNGKLVRIKSPREAIRNGLGFVTESRLDEGLFGFLSVAENTSIAILDKIAGFLGFIDRRKQRELVSKTIKGLEVKTPGLSQLVRYLSGGNQQKVILARWLLTDPSVLILDEPTRGIDVGARREIYRILGDLVSTGKSVLLISSEVDEVYDASDRILVMKAGRVNRRFRKSELSRNELLAYVTEGSQAAHHGGVDSD